jgi:hypothetical protein
MIRHINRAKYDTLKAINWSTLKTASTSLLHYKYALEHKPEPTPAMVRGIAIHHAVFEPEIFMDKYAVWRGARKAGKEWLDFLASAGDREILTGEAYDQCLAIRAAVRGSDLVVPYLKGGKAEVSITWKDPITGLECKGRLDWLSRSPPVTLDLKSTSRGVGTADFGRQAAGLLYHAGAAWYVDGLACATRSQIRPFVFVAVETDPPHDVATYAMTPDALEAGRREYRRLLDLVSWAIEHDKWPGSNMAEQDLYLPTWAAGNLSNDDQPITIGGQAVTM